MELHVIINGRKDLADTALPATARSHRLRPPGRRAQLPPSRLLAAQLGVSRKTVSDTYATLTYEGLLVGKIGRGTFVNSRTPPTERLQTATDLACAANLAKWQALPSPMHHPHARQCPALRVPRRRHQPPPIPQDEWRRCTQDALRRIAQNSGLYSQTEGLLALRSAIAGHIAFPVGSNAAPTTSWSPTARSRLST